MERRLSLDTKELLKRYIWLINTIAKKPAGFTLQEIQDFWDKASINEFGEPLARSTFNRYREAIESIFGISIECSRGRDASRYYIGNSNDLKNDAVQKWILDTMAVSNLLVENKSIHDRVLLESIPSAEPYLGEVMEAMKRNLKILMGYQKYNSEPSPERIVEPFCLKLYRRRWYLLARLEDGKLRTFSVDRITSLKLTDTHFQMPANFDPESFFMDTVGIVLSDNHKKERIVVRAFGHGRFYLRDLPYHPSQRLIAETDEYADFEYHFIPNSEFTRDILGQRGYRQVIEPQWLADEIRKAHEESAEMYKSKSMIVIESHKKSRKSILEKYPGAKIIDVTSHATDNFVKLSPFYPHGDIPVPFTENMKAKSVEGIWQGLKVFENHDIDTSLFRNDTMENLKRSTRKYGKMQGHRKGVGNDELLGYLAARHEIYVPTYRWVLENKVKGLIKWLREERKKRTIVLLDYNTNPNVNDPGKPLSHAYLIKAYVEGLYPYEDQKDAE